MDQLFVDNLNQLKGKGSAASFAKDCNIMQQTMHNYLNGNTDPKLPALRKIAAANHISISQLVGETTDQGGGHTAIGVSGVMQAGGTITGSTIGQGMDLDQTEKKLIEKLRRVGSPIMIQKIMDQLQQLEDFVIGK